MTISTQHPGWLEIFIKADPILHDALGAFFMELGSDGFVEESFDDGTFKAYLPFPEDVEKIRSRIDIFLEKLKILFPETGPSHLNMIRIEDQDWDSGWRRFFQPLQATSSLLILPAWEPVTASAQCHVIRIDPGPAFGTGQHPTTRMCLRAMEKVVSPGPWSMLDVGTGSGILSIYGALLGARRIAAIDNDPEAIRWAERNIDLNSLPIQIELSLTPLAEWKERFSIVTGNLILGTILGMCPGFPDVMTQGGRLILSGILRDQVLQVKEGINRYGLYVQQVLFDEEWACIIAGDKDN
ncbi:MAG: 50S ribosomal protein L11 methyltransferase [Deltaproteobacteria bacterium]|nr:50S ribosomal protein L11 methyltransferase [Deltaproteobacteria bacterium]